MRIFEADLATGKISLLMKNANKEDLKLLVDFNIKAKQDAFYAAGKIDITIFINRKVSFFGDPDLGNGKVLLIRNAGEQNTPDKILKTTRKIRDRLYPKLRNKDFVVSDFAKTRQHLLKAKTIRL